MKAKSLSMVELLDLEATCSIVEMKQKLAIQSDDKLFDYILISIRNIISNKYTYGVDFISYENVVKNIDVLFEELVKKEGFSFHFITKKMGEIKTFFDNSPEYEDVDKYNFAVSTYELVDETSNQILSIYQGKIDYDPVLLEQTLDILSTKKIDLTSIKEIVNLNGFKYYDNFFELIYLIGLRELKTINSENYGKSKIIIDNCINSYLLLAPIIGLYDDPKVTTMADQIKSLLNESLNRKEQFMLEDKNTKCLKYLGGLGNSISNALAKYNRLDKMKVTAGVNLPISDQQRMLIVADPDNVQEALTKLYNNKNNMEILDELPIKTGIMPFYFNKPIEEFSIASLPKKDFRNHLVLTIDPPHSKMLDDGFSISKDKSNNYVLYYFQPYLCEFLDNNTEVRSYARNIGETVFGAGRTILQYPPSVCLDRFSLLRGKDTDTEVFIMTIDRYGNVLSFDREIGIARSSYQLDYNQTSKILNEGCKDYELTRSVNELNELFHILKEKNSSKRVIAYLGEEINYSSGKPQAIVQEIALLGGEQRGIYLLKNNIPGIFRVQEQPTSLEVYNTVIEDRKKKTRIDSIRIVPRSFYTADRAEGNLKHFGLKIYGYTHGSTLRRSVAEFNQEAITKCSQVNRPADATIYRFEKEAHDLANYVNATVPKRECFAKKLGTITGILDRMRID